MKNAYDIDDTIKTYFNSLKTYKPLTKTEEHDLIKRYRYNGDIMARNRLVKSNLRYTCKLASSYRNRGISFSDLISEANIGLLEAIDKFDLSQNVKLMSYSKWWIMHKIQTAIEKKDRMPESEIPTEDFTPVMEEEDTAPVRQSRTIDDAFLTETEESEVEKNNEQFISVLMDSLNEREEDMINMYFGRCGYKEHTLDEIGGKYHLTKERVRQIIEGAKLKLRSLSMTVGCKYLSR